MTDHPILFKGDMILAIQNDSKTQTRRIIKNMPEMWHRGYGAFGGKNPHGDEEFIIHGDCGTETIRCRYPVGDLIWVRETTKTWWRAESSPPPYHSYRWTEYRADSKCVKTGSHYIHKNEDKPDRWMPSIFMPKVVCRLWLKVKSVRVERVQEISRSDIRAEGLVCPKNLCSDDLEYNYKHWYVDEWIKLWDSINAKPRPRYSKKEITHYESYPWEDIRETREHRGKPWHVVGNPFVFAVEFERTEQ